jgi:hypothetical protein
VAGWYILKILLSSLREFLIIAVMNKYFFIIYLAAFINEFVIFPATAFTSENAGVEQS